MLELSDVLISTYWNVNLSPTFIDCKSRKVLISTYWNVNVQMKYDFEGLVAVLISTYWNVNNILFTFSILFVKF